MEAAGLSSRIGAPQNTSFQILDLLWHQLYLSCTEGIVKVNDVFGTDDREDWKTLSKFNLKQFFCSRLLTAAHEQIDQNDQAIRLGT